MADREQQPRGVEALKEHITRNKVDCALWFSRMLTIVFAIAYVLPIFNNPQTAFNKVLLASMATSALRLHQRLPRITFTREFLSLLVVEDSCHYLFFSITFLNVQPMILILFPVVLFAVLHSASYSLTLLDTLGQNSWWGARFLISIVELQTRNILRLASFSEIILMPLTVLFVFLGRAGLMTPLLYYHFLTFRYASRRNPYTRNMFYELRLATETASNNRNCPAILSKALRTGVALVSRLAPAVQVAPPPPPQQPQQEQQQNQ